MKNFCYTFLLLCMGFVSAATVRAASKPELPPQAVVVTVKGKATATGADGVARTLKQGDFIGAGDTIETAFDASLVLDLGRNGNALKVRPSTVLTFDKLTRQQAGGESVVDTAIDLKKGSVLGNVKKLNAASRYQVKTSNGIAGIRGTSFEIFAIGVYRCITGQIVVTISNLSNPAAPPQAFTVTPGSGLGGNGGAPVLAPIPPAEMKALLNDVRGIPQFLGGGIVQGKGLPPEIRDAIRREVLNRLRESANGDKPTLSGAVDGLSADTAARLAFEAASAVINPYNQHPAYTPAQIQAATAAARNAYLTVITADPNHPKAKAHAAALAAAGASLVPGITPDQIAAAAAFGVQLVTELILNGADLPYLYFKAVSLPTASPNLGILIGENGGLD